MEYADALRKLAKTYGLDYFRQAFLVRSILSDEVGASVNGKRLIDALFYVSKALDLIDLFRSRGLEQGKKEVTRAYASLPGNLTKREVVDALAPLMELLCPGEYSAPRRGGGKGAGATVIQKKRRQRQKQTAFIHHVDPQPQSTVQPKAQTQLTAPSPKPVRVNIKEVYFPSNAARVEVKPGSDRYLRISVDGYPMCLYLKDYHDGGHKAIIPLEYPGSTVVVELPKRSFDKLTIVGAETYIWLYSGLDIDTIRLANKGGAYICCYCGCKNIEVRSEKGFISLDGSYANISAKSTDGNLFMMLDQRGRSEVNISADVGGSVEGRFRRGRMKPSVSGLFRHPRSASGDYSCRRASIRLNLKAKRGITFR